MSSVLFCFHSIMSVVLISIQPEHTADDPLDFSYIIYILFNDWICENTSHVDCIQYFPLWASVA